MGGEKSLKCGVSLTKAIRGGLRLSCRRRGSEVRTSKNGGSRKTVDKNVRTKKDVESATRKSGNKDARGKTCEPTNKKRGILSEIIKKIIRMNVKLKKWLDENHYSQKEFAEAIGVSSQSTVCEWMTKDRTPQPRAMRDIDAFFHRIGSERRAKDFF